ncbi:MarR family winged helix-turn-helix transcriptional regulator [Indioceanicola profundi]|uniref:MarR family winged helix-turn-helix transcriptional regulator n=1 Tax=Indioceanicola profundi TaxID=2220096 RepID=UPI000E6AD42E|nr:MarR family winged helix-turn-helix transcriptional regulator [Indioceanicola profundi]
MSSGHQIFFLMTRASHALTRFVDRELDSRFSITSTQLAALTRIAADEGCLLTELAAGLGLNKSAVTTLARRLERQGLAVREASAADGRATSLWLTDAGREVVTRAGPLLVEFDARLADDLSREEAALVAGFLSGLLDRFAGSGPSLRERTYCPPARHGRLPRE